MKTGQKRVLELRAEAGNKWPGSPPMDAWAFLVTEVGEVGDALLRLGYAQRSDYVRNTDRQPDLEAELGDVFLMLCTLATSVHVNLDEALDEVIYRLRKRCQIPHEEVDEVIKRLKEESPKVSVYEEVEQLLLNQADFDGVDLVDVVDDLTGRLRRKYGYTESQ